MATASRVKKVKPATKTKAKTKPKDKSPAKAKPANRAAGVGADPTLQPLLDAIWKNPDDSSALSVYADRLSELGSSRGEYIQLCLLPDPTDEQLARARKIYKADRGSWVGAARPFLRSWMDQGKLPSFIEHAYLEADKLIAGFDHLVALGPRVVLTVTSMRKQRRQTEARMAQLSLHKICDLDIGDNALDDTSIATLAPALAGIRGLQVAGNEITGAGFAELGKHVHSLEFLQVGVAIGLRNSQATLIDGIADAIARTPGFRSLRYLHFFRTGVPSGERIKQLRAAIPNLSRISGSTYTEWEGVDPASWTSRPDDL